MFWFFCTALLAALWCALIFFGGSRLFGRGATQRWIDRGCGRRPALRRFFNAIHGHLRAAVHYVEFGALTAILYVLLSFVCGRRPPEILSGDWHAPAAWLAWGLACVGAYLDELHQAATPGRQFRRIDFMHSLFGAALMFLALLLYFNWPPAAV